MSNPQTRIVQWLKWNDPMGLKEDDEDEFVEETEFDKIQNSKVALLDKVKAAALTNFGLIPVNQYNDPSKNFDYWVCHTNFYIGKKTAKTIISTPGVEMFEPFGPYRFRISIGKVFNSEEVRKNITKRITSILPKKSVEAETLNLDNNLRKEILDTVDNVSRENDYWVVLVAPNSVVEVSVAKSHEDFVRKKTILGQSRDLAGGILLSSDTFGV